MSAELISPQLRVLLVEDNSDDAALVERYLQRGGYQVELLRVETASAMHAALHLGETLPDLVLGDYHLPNFSGPEALQLLQASGLDIPFLMMSGAVSEQTAVDSMRAGAQDYISKQNLLRLVPAVERELREASGRRNKRQAEEALLASEARFRYLVDAMPMGLFLNDSEGRILYANEAIAKLLGRSEIDLTSGDLMVGDLCPDAIVAQEKCSQFDSAPPPFESACLVSDGGTLETLIGVALLNPQADARTWQFATFVADLSLQKRSQEALRRTEKLAVAGRFAASIAHEINNPLEAITNCLYLAATTNLPEDARGYIDLAQKELNRVSQITVQTLRFFRGSTKHDATNLGDLVETVLALLDSRLMRAKIEVLRQFRTENTVVAQAGEIRQVIANLIGNALDAMPQGGHLTVRTARSRRWRSGEEGVAITVVDTGSGMNAEVRARIFEPFFSTKGITGTGLGLWISQEIITKHNGTFHLRSHPSSPGHRGGTVFRVFLPLHSSPEIENKQAQ